MDLTDLRFTAGYTEEGATYWYGDYLEGLPKPSSGPYSSVGIDYKKEITYGMGGVADLVKTIPYYRTSLKEGELINAESLRKDQVLRGLIPVYFDVLHCDTTCIDLGPPSFAFHYKGGGILLAVNHPRASKDDCGPGSPSGFPSESSESGKFELPQNVTDISSHIIATISGKLEDCELLLKELKMKCSVPEGEERKISVVEVSLLMADILAYRREVGLVAGWDEESGAELCRVDGMGVVIKGKRFASGSALVKTYHNMERYGGYSSWDFRTAANSIIDVANRTRKGPKKVIAQLGSLGEDFVSGM
ncbi:OLC1v1038831C1 [Oldenlandia corymbosa var. corymbosa]|uniref:OLC1v1038831C1 n=1 Tax=Oldenlandia corymbosa var. corymbosa TaxID=529605 RepID=A0AAV1D0P6_OLDCO|nr:OLC1v1038831C1 [Oldenlandia corymbosa var. corymbosa]